MDVDLIFRIAAVGILVAVLGQLLTRSGRDEHVSIDGQDGERLCLSGVENVEEEQD